MKSLTFILLLFSCSQLFAQNDVQAFEAFLEKTYQDFELPSMTVAIVKDGKTVFSKGYGKRSEESNLSPDENTLYAIASLSKAFTAASIGMLVDEGKIKWNDPVKKHYPAFQMYDPYVTEHMTIEDLLCHRSGLITFDGDLLWYATNYTREEAVERIKYYKPTYEFRDEFGYQNLMFMTAGEVIESVSGMTWDDFVAQRILKPLQMNRTTASFDAFLTDLNMAKPYVNGEQILMLSYNNSGATAALNSCVSDMGAWMNFWLDRGIVGGDTLLSPNTVNKIFELQTPLPVGNFDAKNGTHFKGYAMGWFLMDYQGVKVVHHGGGLPGYITKVALVPEQDLGIVVMTTDMTSASTMLMYAAIDWMNGRDYTNWLATFIDFKKKGEEREAKSLEERLLTQKSNPTLLPLQNYLGLYRDPSYGDVKISMGEQGLIMSMLPTKELFTGKLTPWSDHAFRFDHNDPFLTYGVITFEVKDNKTTGFKMELPNYDFHFDKLDFMRVD